MKTLILTILLSLTPNAFAETNSVYTDLKADCIVVSQATDEAPIDFFTSECKAYGGYTLKESGGDLRYGPELIFNGKEINLQRPLSFHQLASRKIEWAYDLTRDNEGSGTINFKALIYRISEDTDHKGKSATFLHVIRLKGEDSCLIGKVKTNQQARDLANNTDAECIELEF
jgi:hypothetical protein